MENLSKPKWSPWGSVKLAIELVKGLFRSISRIESDPTAAGLMNLALAAFTPIIILGFVVLSFFWYLVKLAFSMLRGGS